MKTIDEKFWELMNSYEKLRSKLNEVRQERDYWKNKYINHYLMHDDSGSEELDETAYESLKSLFTKRN